MQARPGGTGKRQSYKSAAPLGGRTLSPSWEGGGPGRRSGPARRARSAGSAARRSGWPSLRWAGPSRPGPARRSGTWGCRRNRSPTRRSGTLYPALARARMTPMAMTSLMAKTAVNWARRASRAVHGVVGRFKIVVGQAVQPGDRRRGRCPPWPCWAPRRRIRLGWAGGRAADHADLAGAPGRSDW